MSLRKCRLYASRMSGRITIWEGSLLIEPLNSKEFGQRQIFLLFSHPRGKPAGSGPRHLSVSLNFSAESSYTREAPVLKEPELKRKYAGEKRVFIAAGAGALALLGGGTAFACFTSSGPGGPLARRDQLRRSHRQRRSCSLSPHFTKGRHACTISPDRVKGWPRIRRPGHLAGMRPPERRDNAAATGMQRLATRAASPPPSARPPRPGSLWVSLRPPTARRGGVTCLPACPQTTVDPVATLPAEECRAAMPRLNRPHSAWPGGVSRLPGPAPAPPAGGARCSGPPARGGVSRG